MSNTNYCADFLSSTEHTVLSHRLSGIDKDLVRLTRGLIQDSVKFRLPENGALLDVLPVSRLNKTEVKNTYSKYLHSLELPYPDIALEFPVRENDNGAEYTGKMIVLATNNGEGSITWTVLVGNPSNVGRGWFNTALFGVIDDNFDLSARSLRDVDRETGMISREENTILLMSLNVILSFMCAMQCSNTKLIDQPAPKLLNKKREKKGKQPFFSYKVLTIDTEGSKQSKNTGKGSHASPRVHLRRGHIRRLKDKTVWISPCVVGDKTKGVIHKDYSVI